MYNLIMHTGYGKCVYLRIFEEQELYTMTLNLIQMLMFMY